jgi:phage tail sheath protein FI
MLEPIGVNPLRELRVGDVRPWGSRTMSSDPSTAGIEAVRTTLAIVHACGRGLDWAACEPSTVGIRSLVRRRTEAFLQRLWHDGALLGSEASEAFVVRCDEHISPPDAPVRVMIGVAAQTAGDLRWYSIGGSGEVGSPHDG